MQKTRNVIIKNQQKYKIRGKKVSILKKGDTDFYEILISFAGGILCLIHIWKKQKKRRKWKKQIELKLRNTVTGTADQFWCTELYECYIHYMLYFWFCFRVM